MTIVDSDEPVTTSSGTKTTAYLDIPGVLGDNMALGLAARVMMDHIAANISCPDLMVNTVGGPTTGAIPLVLGLAMFVHDDLEWFVIRDRQKNHGLGRWYVGAEPGPGSRVVLVDDVASSGRSLVEAAARVVISGAKITAVMPLVDRGNQAAAKFARVGIPYLPVLTYRDLGLEPLE